MNFKTKLFTNKSTVLWRRYKHFVVEGGKKKKRLSKLSISLSRKRLNKSVVSLHPE